MSFEDGSDLLQKSRQVVAKTLESSSEEERTRLGCDAREDPGPT